MKKYYVYSASHVGKIRRNNEDNFLTGNYYRKDLKENIFSYEHFFDNKGVNVIAVFDGMGGTQSGEKASLISVSCLYSYIQHVTEHKETFDAQYIIKKINQTVCKYAKELSNNMGSTLVMLVYENGFITSYNVGDSRAYLFRDKKLTQLSFDHTEENMFKQMQLECGLKCDVSKSGHKHILTQHLGIDESEFLLEPHISQKIQVKKDDLFLLCSDGLTNMVNDNDIVNIFEENTSIKCKVDKLIDKALEAGGKDNITVTILG